MKDRLDVNIERMRRVVEARIAELRDVYLAESKGQSPQVIAKPDVNQTASDEGIGQRTSDLLRRDDEAKPAPRHDAPEKSFWIRVAERLGL